MISLDWTKCALCRQATLPTSETERAGPPTNSVWKWSEWPYPHFELCLAEMNEDGYSYTYRTLERFREDNPEEEYYFIIGADSLFDFDIWREPGRICKACTIVVATRNQTSNERLDLTMERMRQKFDGTFLKLDTPNLDISSKHIRQWIEENRTIQYYVPDCVREYIEKYQMYKDCD